MIGDLQLYDIVVISHKPDATLWRVLDIQGFRIGVVDADLDNSGYELEAQYIDKASLKRPTDVQLLRLEQ